mgnify:CR=1 FL=1
MRVSLMITPLVYMMVQAVLFGTGMIVILTTSLAARADVLMPWMIGLSFIVSIPISLAIAPHLKARREIVSSAPTV